jgi:hypothetical protein
VGMLAFGILGRNFGTLEHLKALNDAGSWLTISLIEASAGILALLLAAVVLGERIERGVEGPHFISLIRLTARGGFATIAPAVIFDVLKITSTSMAREGWVKRPFASSRASRTVRREEGLCCSTSCCPRTLTQVAKTFSRNLARRSLEGG